MADYLTQHRYFIRQHYDQKKFGEVITFKNREDTVTYTVNGSINAITPHMDEGPQPQALGSSVGISVLRDDLLEKAGYPGDLDYLDNMPMVGWLVVLFDKWTNEEKTYTIEKGQDLKDGTVGLDGFWLVEYV